ncbi:MAG: sensor histidine kinase [Leptolyngbyaceae cyanobacterium SM1_3_5]|nr:sensor histidine kinase [Leptolyngbyaceae cyanobacterium SM1_3_5]
MKLRPHPFRLLLYLEWILLGLSAFKIFGFPGWSRPIIGAGNSIYGGEDSFYGTVQIEPLNAVALAVLLISFGLLGFRSPLHRWGKWLYMAIGCGLVLAIAHFNGWALDSLSPLLIIVVLRSCLLFEKRGRWLMAGLVWLIYPFTIAPFLIAFWIIFHPWVFRQSSIHSLPGINFASDGSIQINYNFNPDQVTEFLEFAQNSILYTLLDNLLSFGLILIFVLLLTNALVSERQGRRKLALAHEQLYQYSIQIEDQATLQERTRIARDLHDALGHLLAAQNIQLQNALLSFKSNLSEAQIYLEDSQRLGTDALNELRQTVALLRSDPLQGRSIEAAISALVQDFSQMTGIQPNCQLHIINTIPHRIQLAAYRILEEALTNIYKYSEATEVNIWLAPDRDHLDLEISDNGKGFDIEANRTGFGLRGMEERSTSLGGTFQINSQPDLGCSIVVSFPLINLTI